MRVYRSAAPAGIKGPVVTLGNFDGVHRGHRLIIAKVVSRARALGTSAVVYTFDPHPLKVVAPEKSPPLITGIEEKKAILKSLGADALVLAPFTREFAAKHPREFVEEALVAGLNAREVWVGSSFAFGRGKLGTVEYLKELGREFGFLVRVVPPLKMGGTVVSSSRIRKLIQDGEVEEAGRLLGGHFSVRGVVVKGSGVGRVLGFPTANLKVEGELVPGRGVYAAWASVGTRRHYAAVNVGHAPTFGPRALVVEAHLIGFTGRLYGRRVRLAFVEKIREETEFPSREALGKRIVRDIERAVTILKRDAEGRGKVRW